MASARIFTGRASPDLNSFVPPGRRKGVLSDIAVGMMINSMLSFVFAFDHLRGIRAVPLWGASGMALDFIPQTFMIGLATTIAITLSLRRKLRRGVLEGISRVRTGLLIRVPENILLRALTVATVVTALAVPAAVLGLFLAGIQSLSPVPFVMMKAIYGVGLTVFIGPYVARVALTRL